jgi:hypothetical protein
VEEKMKKRIILILVGGLLLSVGPLSLNSLTFAAEKSISTLLRSEELLLRRVAMEGAIELNKPSCTCQQVQRKSAKFAEVEILLSPKFDLAYISALPRAPDSDLKILDNPRRVIVQLSAAKIKNLLDKGAGITVLRNFILVQDAQSNSAGDGSITATAVCSGPYIYGENNTNVPLIYVPGFGIRAAISPIVISDAPSGAVTTCIDVGFTIYHSFPLDLVVLLDNDSDCSYTLFEGEFLPPGSFRISKTNISACNGVPVNQRWVLMAGSFFSSGYIDSWWIKVYYEQVPPPSNDNCANAIALQEGVPYKGSTLGATGVNEGSYGDANDVYDVWHSFTPSHTGLVTISLYGSKFDTTLTVFDRCGGIELASSDDTCGFLYSEITMFMTAGNTYLIRVAGFEFEQGDYTLTVISNPSLLPTNPKDHNPASGAANVPVNAILSWDCTIEKTSQLQSNSADVDSSKNTINLETIYGKDDQLDEYEVADPNILVKGDATVMTVPRFILEDNHDGTYSLPGRTFAEWYLRLNNYPLCPNERFRNQPAPGQATGFLVASDIIATAGHVACREDCNDMAFVFGFVMRDANTALLRIPESDVYYCREIVVRQEGDPDWGLIRLDRKVPDHKPLPLRHTGIVPDNEPILIIGHPYGLPRKYAAGATVHGNTASAYFLANLDTYDGSSGSPVLNANTLVVEGILYAGPACFITDGSCDRSNVCPDAGCPEWPYLEYVTRSTEFSPLIPLFDVYLGTDPNQLNQVCFDALVPWCDPGSLQNSVTYYWRVVAKNCYGRTEGPILSFTTVR